MIFQSTHSITECDPDHRDSTFHGAHFNPRTPLQSAIFKADDLPALEGISIHALHYRVRSWCHRSVNRKRLYFNPRTPLQSAIRNMFCVHLQKRKFQSTHSITECDVDSARQYLNFGKHFNPRTPLQSAMVAVWSGSIAFTLFQSTHSITECDHNVIPALCYCVWISIHALHYRVR